jgi:HEAT repeat protein
MPSSQDISVNPCEICKDIPESAVAYLDRDDELPLAARQLRRIGEYFRQCPFCQTYYYYDYWPPGPGNIGNREDLDRFTPEENECIRPLLEATETTNLAPYLAKALSSDQEQLRTRAKDAYAYAVQQVGFQVILATLAQLLAHPNTQVRRFASEALAESARDQDIALALGPLHTGLTDEDPWIQCSSSKALAHHFLREHKVQELQALLHNNNASIRLGAIYAMESAALTKTAPTEILADVIQLLTDDLEAIRTSAAYALSDLAAYCDIACAAPALGKALLDTPRVRQWALKALNQAAWRNMDILSALPFFNQVLLEKDENFRIDVARVLQCIAAHDITPVLPSLIENLRNSSVLCSTLRQAVAPVIAVFAEQKQENAQFVRELFSQAKLKKELNPEITALFKKLNSLTKRRRV